MARYNPVKILACDLVRVALHRPAHGSITWPTAKWSRNEAKISEHYSRYILRHRPGKLRVQPAEWRQLEGQPRCGLALRVLRAGISTRQDEYTSNHASQIREGTYLLIGWQIE